VWKGKGRSEGQVRLFAVSFAPRSAVRGLHVPAIMAPCTRDRDGLAVRGVHGLLHTIHMLLEHVFAGGVRAAFHMLFKRDEAIFVQFEVFAAQNVLFDNGFASYVFVHDGVAFFVEFEVFAAYSVFFIVRMANFVGIKIGFALENRVGWAADAFGKVRGAPNLRSAFLPDVEVGVAHYMTIPMDRALLMNIKVGFAGRMDIEIGFANLMVFKIGLALLMDIKVRLAGRMDIIVGLAHGMGIKIGFAILMGFALLDHIDVWFADVDPVDYAQALFLPARPHGAVFDYVAIAVFEAIGMALGRKFGSKGRNHGLGERHRGDKQGTGNDTEANLLHSLFPLKKTWGV